jgi:hypothetical protein
LLFLIIPFTINTGTLSFFSIPVHFFNISTILQFFKTGTLVRSVPVLYFNWFCRWYKPVYFLKMYSGKIKISEKKITETVFRGVYSLSEKW